MLCRGRIRRLRRQREWPAADFWPTSSQVPELKRRFAVSCFVPAKSLINDSRFGFSGRTLLRSQPGSWLLSVMRTSVALPPSSHGMEQRMPRRPFKHEKSFQERLAEEARKYREAAEKLPPGSHAKELLLRRVRQAETASHISDWLSSPGLQSPRALETLLAGKK